MPKQATDLTPIFSSPGEVSAKTDKAMIDGITSTFPIEDKNYRIEVEDVHVDKKDFDHEDEKDAILRGKSLTYPVRGTVKMYDKETGDLVDTVKNFNLADTYALTGKHTTVYRGNNYNVSNLIVLKPGVYTRSRDNDELESSINTQTGSNFSIVLDPQSYVFNVRAGSVKTAGVPLFPIMEKVFGVGPEVFAQFLPNEMLKANVAAGKGQEVKAITNLYGKMVNKRVQNKSLSIEEKAAALKEAIEASTLDVSTTETTLGKSFSHVEADVIVRACRNLIDIKRGDRPEDNRDSLQFKRVQNLPDFIASHFRKNNANVTGTVKNIQRSLGRVDKSDPKIRSVLSAKPFSKVFTNFLINSSLASTPTETNPIESIENVGKATIIGQGYGGIGSAQGVPDEARNIDPSHLGILDPSRTPESGMAGIDQRFTMTARRDENGDMYARVLDTHGKEQYLSSNEMMSSVIGFPDGMGTDKPNVMAQKNGRFSEVPRESVQYWIPAGSDLYTVTTNMVPFFNSNHPGRLTMAGKALPQSLSLKHREQPLVQTVDHTGTPYIKRMADIFSSKFVHDGVVNSVTPRSVTVTRDDNGENYTVKLVNNLPYNMKGFHDDDDHAFKVGDRVHAGQTVADNNYTRDGKLAIGKNLQVGYMAYKGFNNEDGIVISRGACEKLTSNHAYKESYTSNKTTVMDTNKFRAQFGRKYTPQQLTGFSNTGLPSVGRKLHYGDPIALIMEERTISDTDKMLGKLHKSLISPFRDSSIIWEHHEIGDIVDVEFTGKDLRVLVRTEKQLGLGDKITGLHGNKGVVSLILEDDEMPHDGTTGKPLDLILNPASVTSRINLGQVLETAAAKVAEKTGVPYLVKNYGEENNILKIKQDLAKNGLSDTSKVYDPKTGKVFSDRVLTGPQYILKLDKTVDANYSARSVGGYDNIGQPTKGGDDGAKSVGYMEMLGLLGSNARKNLKEISTIKSEGGHLTDSDGYWDKYMRGAALPKPKTTFATKKFFDYMVGCGINVSHRNGELTLNPLTDKDILAKSNGALSNVKMVYGKDAKAEKGGLFDVAITGGPDGHKWSHIELPEAIVNPVMEDPVRNMLGLKKKEYEDITSGKLGVVRVGKGSFNLVDTSNDALVRNVQLNASSMFTKQAEHGEMVVGGDAFKQMLSDITPSEEIAILKDKVMDVKSVTKRNEMIKKMKYLQGMVKQGYDNPADAVMLHNLPVIPPVMRPISVSNGRATVADINELYKDLHLVAKGRESKDLGGVAALRDLVTPDYPELQDARRDTYDAAKAIMNGGAPVNYANKQLGLKGLMTQISGVGGPKYGFFQSKLMSKKQDISGRGTIYAAPDVGFNEAKIPVDMLLKMFEPHIRRDLSQKGYDVAAAKQAHASLFTEQKNGAALASFNKIVKEVPVIINRAPTLMKSNILAMKAIPSDANTIGINILHLPGFAADYDGDAMSVFAPVTPEAIKEANEKLLPEHNLNDARMDAGTPMYKPQHEAILGSMYLTEHDGSKAVEFATEAAALAALKSGKIKPSTPIRITSK